MIKNNQRWPALSISRQIPLLMGGMLFFSLLLAGVVAISQISNISREQATSLGNTLVKQTAISARDALVAGDQLSLNILLNQLAQAGGVASASIYDADNARIAVTESKFYRPTTTYAQFTSPIEYQHTPIGRLLIEIDADLLGQPAQESLLIFLGIALLLGLTGMVLSWRYAKKRQLILRHSIVQLVDLSGDHVAYQPSVRDEFIQLVEQINYLIEQDSERATIAARASEPEPAATVERSPVELIVPEIPEDEPVKEFVVLALCFTNFSQLYRELGQAEMIRLLQEQLPCIKYAVTLHDGELAYSAEGHAYISFSKDCGADLAAFKAICCVRLIETLFDMLKKEDEPRLSIEQGISTITPRYPGDEHPSLVDAATSQALMLAKLGHGRLLLDGQYTDESLKDIQAVLVETDFGADIYEVMGLSQEYKQLLERQARQIIEADPVLPH